MRPRPTAMVPRTIFAIFLGVFATFAMAGDQPTGRVILEVSGAITKTNGDGVMRFDREMLEEFGLHDITTETPWTEGPTTFTGVLARDVMDALGATGAQISAVALNDYTVAIPLTDFEAYNVILAIKRDGEYLTVRDRGPIWVIYPWSDVKGLQNELYYSRSIWQLRALEVRPN